MDTMVLLKVLLMCACPWETFLRSLRRTFLTAGPPGRALGGISLCAPQLLLAGLLLTGHRALGTLAGARVGPGALSAHRQAPAVPDTRVAADLDLAPDVRGDFAAQVTFDLEVALDEVTQLHNFLVGQVLGSLARVDARGDESRRCPGPTDPEDIGERDLHPLFAGEVDAD